MRLATRRVTSLGVPGAVLRPALIAMSIVVFAAATFLTLHIQDLGERDMTVQQDLLATLVELRTQDALEWRAISARVAPADVRPALGESRDTASSLLAGAAPGDTELRELLAAYDTAVDRELDLLAAGRLDDAVDVDEEEVDPAFEAALDALGDRGDQAAAASATNRHRSDVLMVATVMCALGLTTLLQSRRRRAEVRRDAERRGEARYRALVDRSADLVLVVDPAGRATYLSPSAERAFGVQDLGGSADAPLSLLAITHEQDRGRLSAVLASPDAADRSVQARWRSDGRWRMYEISVQDLTDVPAVSGLVITAHDVTDRHALEREMEHRALHDALTGLPNRVLLADRFEQALHHAQRTGTGVGLLLIDLDRFKEINDTLGHHVGDALLERVGQRMVGALRAVDTVARLGGDEFAVLLPDVASVADALAVASTVQAALSETYPVLGVDLDVEASIGVVVSGEHGDDATTLMQRADVAMYVAKQKAVGSFAYDPAMDAHSPERFALLGDLRRAVTQDELFLEFQPQVSLSSGEVCGAEALVRWAHPTRGRVAPGDFIPLAENTGLIGPITGQVLDLALAQARRWIEDGTPLQVSVNLSARNLSDEHVERTVLDMLARHGVPAALLKLEVTESALMTDPVRARLVLQRLDSHGIQIAIDDFGAGYTSLTQLKDLPVTELKLDRSFVSSMCSQDSDAVIVRSLVKLSHSLGLTAVAEGVETAEVLDSLREAFCDVAQGFHVARPMSAAAFDAWRATRDTTVAVGTPAVAAG